jgi:D-alanyl-D-alanine carboxypeptidase
MEKVQLRRFVYAIGLLFVLTLFQGGSSAAESGSQEIQQAESIRHSTAHEVQQLLDQKVAEYGIPGAVMAVMKGGRKAQIFVSGVASLSDNRPITGKDRFRVGSNTKTFAAMTILQLAQEGKLSLDAKLGDALVNWPQGIGIKKKMSNFDVSNITIRQMLQHTSGIFSFTEDDNWVNNFLTNTYYRYEPDMLVSIANSHAPYCSPGGCFHYSNTNYVLLGLIIQEVTGQKLETEIRKRFIEPLGLSNTLVPLMGLPSIPGSSSNGHDIMDGYWFDYTMMDPSSTWCSGNMVSTAADLAKWIMALGRGDLLNRAYNDQQRQWVKMPGYTSLYYGLGVIHDDAYGLIGHQGGIVGYSTQMYYLESEDTALVFLYNITFPNTVKDFSVVMTYDVLPILFPHRRWPSKATVAAEGVERKWRPGLLNEY